jgi:DNA mismatch endonuclease (patch repair protein)
VADQFSSEKRSQIMRKIKSKNTKLENKIISDLWKKGYRFRRNVTSLYGKPDIAVKKYKVVIFIDSCFWHGCPEHCRMPASNKSYWENKIKNNKERDKKVTEHYKEKGWNILRIWEHELKNNYETTLTKIEKFINKAKHITKRST